MEEVYLSHDSQDDPRFTRLRDGLQRKGYPTREDMEHLHKCSILVFLMTNKSVASERCQREWSLALRRGMPIILLQLDDVDPPSALAGVNRSVVLLDDNLQSMVEKLVFELKWSSSSPGKQQALQDNRQTLEHELNLLKERLREEPDSTKLHSRLEELNNAVNALISRSESPGDEHAPYVREEPVNGRIFIAYHRKSSIMAKEIGNYLTTAGFHVWQDIEKMRGTTRWPVEVDRALREADRLLVLLTPEAMQSDEVFNEWFFFYDHRKPIHCLMVEECEPHYQLMPFQYLRWDDPSTRDWQSLVRTLREDFEWPSLAKKEKVVNSPFAPERTLPEALEALKEAILSEHSVVALRDEQIQAIKSHKPTDETTYRLARYAEWCDPRYKLDERFVRLTLLLDEGEDAQRRWIVQEGHKRFTDLREVLLEGVSSAFALLGAPGAGKTTLLRRLEMDVAVDGIRDETHDGLTFFAQLSEYGVGLRDDQLPLPFDWLSARWTIRYPHLPSLDTLLQEGRLLLLLDSLNEMPHTSREHFDRRAELWRSFLNSHILQRPGNKVIFACRSLDYGGVLSSKEAPVPQVRLEPMTLDQVREYLDNYAIEDADLIWKGLEEDERLYELFRIPFMLQMLIERVKIDRTMPQGRAETFTSFVRGLLRREVLGNHPLLKNGVLLTRREWDQLRGNTFTRKPHALPEKGLLVPGLTTLAHAMQERRPGMDKGQVVIEYEDALTLTGVEENHQSDVLKAGCDLTVLDEAENQIRYYHQLLQEYFAARKLSTTPEPQLVRVEWLAEKVSPSLDEILEKLGEGEPLPPPPSTGWEETAILAAAMTNDADAFVRALMDANLPLAARCAATPDVQIGSRLYSEIQQALVDRTNNPKADLRARIAAGFVLGRLGDPRLELRAGLHGQYLFPPMVPISGGTYMIGSDEGLFVMESPEHPVTLEDFEIAKFPVTNAEFRYFVASGGYEDDRWWTTENARVWLHEQEGIAEIAKQEWTKKRKTIQANPHLPAYLLKQGRITLQQAISMVKVAHMGDDEFESTVVDEWHYADGHHSEPRYWTEQHFGNPAQPVIGVCWYEAQAYCAWISAQTGLPFRLPTEFEWEAAARGQENRRYAYGDEFDPRLCNVFESRIRRITPIGVFPGGETPEGCSDMSGNVFEWVHSTFIPYGAAMAEHREGIDRTRIPRGCRGGSWDHTMVRSRSAYRGRGHPFTRNDDLGFRICVGPLIGDV